MTNKFTNIWKVGLHLIGCFPVVLIFPCEYMFHSSHFYEETNGRCSCGRGLSEVPHIPSVSHSWLRPEVCVEPDGFLNSASSCCWPDMPSLLRMNPCLTVVLWATDVMCSADFHDSWGHVYPRCLKRSRQQAERTQLSRSRVCHWCLCWRGSFDYPTLFSN